MDNTIKLNIRETDDEVIENAIKAIQNLADAIIELCQRILEVIRTIINSFWESIKEFLKQTNPKLFHLAFCHKSYKVRKKNRSRLVRLFMRIAKYNE